MNQIELEKIKRDFSNGNANIHLHNIIYEDKDKVVKDLPEDPVLVLSKIKEVDYLPSSGGLSTGMSTYDLIFNVGNLYESEGTLFYKRFCIPGTYFYKKVIFRIKFSDYCIEESFIENALKDMLEYCMKTLNYQFKNGTIDDTVKAFRFRHYYV